MLKHNELILIQTQEELNTLAEVIDGVEVDALHIDEDYAAYIDEVIWVVPLRKLEAGHWTTRVKPTLFRKWIKKQKRF